MIEPHLTARTKLIIINSPSNPSGAVLDRAEFEKIFALTSKRGIYLMTDECYCKFLYDSEPFSIASLPGAKETVLIAGSLSKTYAMTGWRIGFGLMPAPIITAMGNCKATRRRTRLRSRRRRRWKRCSGRRNRSASCWRNIASGAISWWRSCAPFRA
jgi:aspartate/methionine/tyrosine aminotransferase